MIWFLLACTSPNEDVTIPPSKSGAVEINMVVSSAINGEYEPCG